MTTTILVVDDETLIARGVEKRLKGMGYAVTGLASSGEEGVRKAGELRPDLVLMDIQMGGGMDGIEAAERVRRQLGIPVVFLTAHSDPATLQRARCSEPYGYVLKPYEDRDLQIAIEIGLYKHRADRRVQENERWLAATLGSIGDGVIATDEHGRVRLMNPLAERMTGWTQAEAAGRLIEEVFHVVGERTRLPVENPARVALEQGGVTDLAPNTTLIDRAGAERPIDDSAAPIRDVGGAVVGAVLVFRDITDRRQLEEHLRQAQKMEAIGRLAGGIAHDFNNIVAIITGFSELLLADPAFGGDRREFLQHIHDAARRAGALTQQILAFSRKQVLVPAVLSLNTVLRDMAAMVKRLIGADIEFVTDPAANLGLVKVDPTHIGQVILNLAANARDAMPHGGRFVLATANEDVAEQSPRRPAGLAPGRYVVLTAADTGTGIPAGVLPHIFEPYFTTKALGQGTGLGLATVHGVVVQSGGHIVVDSRPGQGTTFRLYLPRVEVAAPTATADALLVARGTETILVADDDETIRTMLRLVLEQSGYRVLDAADGVEGLAAAEGYPGPIHLVLTDVVMPRLGGREMAERLTAARPGLRVLYMSGYTEDAVMRQGVEAAAINFLPKPFAMAALTRRVREVLAGP